jgi:coenzyme F420-0:L-glutamate ligase/coenzyme F420-1:gamma-L-glutamate ligase
MTGSEITIQGVPGLPEIKSGDDIAALILAALDAGRVEARDLDVFVIAQKIISKAEGRIVQLATVAPSALATQWAADYGKDARMVEVVLRESKRIVRMDRGVLISETSHGFICANAGVDASNVQEGTVALLPEDPDRSAKVIKQSLDKRLGIRTAVIISDTFGRPWRDGLVNVALGVAGIAAVSDLRGKRDWLGQTLKVTTVAVADEIASAAELVMDKSAGVPVAIVRGLKYEPAEGTGHDLIRPAEQDIFR